MKYTSRSNVVFFMLLVVLDNWYKTKTETDPSGQLGSIFEGTSGSYFDGQRVRIPGTHILSLCVLFRQ